MSINVPISSLPIAIGLDGSEYVPLDQGGTTKRALVSLINSSNPANLPVGGLTGQALVKTGTSNYQTGWATVGGLGTVQEVDTGTGLTGGPITVTGTVSLANIATGRVLANVSGISAAPTPTTPSAILDTFSSTQGSIMYRDASGWQALAPGTTGRILTTQGAGANPQWSNVGSGTVISVGLALPGIFTVSGSPVTTTGTLTGALATQNANLVWSGPTTGAAATPTFRSLVGADLPVPAPTTLGGVKSLAAVSHQFLTQIGTDGSVSQAQPAFSDISGTIALSQFGAQTANTILSGPTSGGSANPTFRALVGADLPNPSASTLGGVQSLAAVTSKWVNQISTSGVPSATQPAFSDLSGQASLSQLPTISNNTILANTSGSSAVPSATALTTLLDTIGATQGQVLYRNASNWTVLSPGTSGQVLTANGTGANPTWNTVSGTGTVTDIAAGIGITTGGSDITTTGTVALAQVVNNRVLANVSGITAAPTPTTMTSLLDIVGATQGQVLYRGASTWSALSAGTSGQYLQTLGAGSTPQWASAVQSIAGNTGAFTLTGGITNSTNAIKLALNNASIQVTGNNPTGTASASAVMMGFGATCAITPVYSTRVKLDFTGYVTSGGIATASITGRFGTGAAPSNGAASTGTATGSSKLATIAAAAYNVPFAISVILTGLTVATAYWFDLSLSTGAGITVTLANVDFNAMEF